MKAIILILVNLFLVGLFIYLPRKPGATVPSLLPWP